VAPRGVSALAVSFVSFSLRLFRQRKAAKPFCYQDLIDAFSFEARGTKEKALQKENAVFSPARRAVAFEKATQNNRAKCCANIVRAKSQFISKTKKYEQYCSYFLCT
jgi:hypothetical protein